MTVARNLAFPLENRRVPRDVIAARVKEIAGLLGLERVLEREARNLTADLKQKVSLGRGLVRADVGAILFDEPLTVIDPHLKWQLRSMLKELHRRLNVTMIYVTHDQIEALTFADKVVVMHDGAVVQMGTPEQLFERPAHTFVGHFIGSPGMKSWRPRSRARRRGSTGMRFSCRRAYPALPNGQRIEIGVRPEFVHLRPKGLGVPVQVKRIDDIGRARIARVELAGQPLAASVADAVAIDGGEASLAFDLEQLHVYADGHLVAGEPLGTERGAVKTVNQRAWFLVLPVFAIVLFSALLPLMTVVNYSVQDSFGNNQFFWNGIGWFQELLDPSSQLGERFFDSLWRNLLFSAIILLIEVPLGIVVALSMPRSGLDGGPLPCGHGASAADPVERGRHHLAGVRARRHRAPRVCRQPARHRLQLHREPARGLDDHRRDGRVALDEPRRPPVLRRAQIDPRRLLPGGAHRRRLALGGVSHHPTTEDAARAPDRRAAALHGFLHDLYRAIRAHRRRPRQRDHLPVDRPREAGARAIRSRQGGRHVACLQPDHPGDCWVFYTVMTNEERTAAGALR